MTRRDADVKSSERLEQKMEKIHRKLGELPSDAEIQPQLNAISTELAAVETELQTDLETIASPGARARLEAQRERLLAQAERLELRREIIIEKRERLREALEELHGASARRSYTERASVSFMTPSPPQDLRKTREEQRKILEMVQVGRITADEAARLLDALRDQAQSMQRRKRTPRWVRIRVTDVDAKRVRVNLTLPVGLVRAGLRAGGSIAGMEGLNTAELEEMLNRGEVGHILDIQDANDGERVEIFIE